MAVQGGVGADLAVGQPEAALADLEVLLSVTCGTRPGSGS